MKTDDFRQIDLKRGVTTQREGFLKLKRKFGTYLLQNTRRKRQRREKDGIRQHEDIVLQHLSIYIFIYIYKNYRGSLSTADKDSKYRADSLEQLVNIKY